MDIISPAGRGFLCGIVYLVVVVMYNSSALFFIPQRLPTSVLVPVLEPVVSFGVLCCDATSSVRKREGPNCLPDWALGAWDHRPVLRQ